MSKLNKKQSTALMKPAIPVKFDPAECPFREFRDNELTAEFWGLGPRGLKAVSAMHHVSHTKGGDKGKLPSSSFTSSVWHDDQIQPLPRSVRYYLDGWVNPEDLAAERWESSVVVAEENKSDRMSIIDYQLSHTQVLLRSVFCRRVMSACFNLERVESLMVEHQWENFNCVFGPEGWRAKYHIYSLGVKAGGGQQHKPMLSKNGCYLVRLYYLGAWRCIWVSDQVPVDSTGAPLLPFSPLSSPTSNKGKGIPPMITSPYVHLWPLLICKAILKLAAPEMILNENIGPEESDIQDEDMEDFDIMHCLTGALSIKLELSDYDEIWSLLWKEAKIFTWDGDEDQASGAMKSKSVKKPNPKDKDLGKRETLTLIEIVDTKDVPSFTVPGITPAHAMALYVSLVRDVPLKKPLPEPEVPLWKLVRWVDWAKQKGLYEAYECPRSKYLKLTGLTKMSYAPHLLDVQSNESITQVIKEGHTDEPKKTVPPAKKQVKDTEMRPSVTQQIKEELREWVLFDALQPFISAINVLYYPSSNEYTSAASRPPIRQTKSPMPGIDIPAPAAAPLYFQIDGPEENVLKISLSILHPRILSNCGASLEDDVEKAYLFLECFEWFIDSELPRARAFIRTRCYDTVEITFLPGRHFCRLWVHSPTHWQVSLLSESSLVLGTRDVILVSCTLECEWSTRFLSTLGNAFSNWIRSTITSSVTLVERDKEFFASYQPDLTWDPEKIGYIKTFLHWMFRQALQSHLHKRLAPPDYRTICILLSHQFYDPDFGFPPRPGVPRNLREILAREPCECVLPEPEVVEEEEQDEELAKNEGEKIEDIVSPSMMEKLLTEPEEQFRSHVCDLATDELPCGLLKEERLKYIKKHEAATVIQANWRGYYSRKCLHTHIGVSNETIRLLSEHIFGNFEALSSLMNEFFVMFPGARYAYSVSSGLNGMRGLQQHNGTSPVTPHCKWIPYFQGIFYCHCPVKLHFDIHSSLEHTSVQIYDNDSGEQLPQAYNAHITFHIEPNVLGYTVMGHGSLNFPLDIHHDIEIPWNFTILASLNNVFHLCDNGERDICTTMPLTHATKFHLQEMFIPNRRNILGSMQIAVVNVECISFRAETTLPNLEIEAILQTTDTEGNMEEIARCSGKGEIFWPYLYLKPHLLKNEANSSGNLTNISITTIPSSRALSKKGGKSSKVQSRSLTKLPPVPKPLEPKTYTIEVIAPEGWALPLNQWKTVDDVRNTAFVVQPPPPVVVEKEVKAPKVSIMPKTGSAKSDKKKEEEKQKEKVEVEKPAPFVVYTPKPGDAMTVLECSTTVGGGAGVRRDDTRDILFANTLRNWNLKDPARNNKGAEIRQSFREEYLVQAAVKSETVSISAEGEYYFEEDLLPKPMENVTSPVTELAEMAVEVEEESLYYTMPEAIRDKFVPLYFIPECTREMFELKGVLFTEEMMEAAKAERVGRFEAALQRMRDLQYHNEQFVLEDQRIRIQRLASLDVDDVWCDGLVAAFEELGAACHLEVAKQQAAMARKKVEQQIAKEAEKVQGKKPKGK